MEHDYYVYMLQCSDGSYYTGITNDYHRRLKEHQKGIHMLSYTYSRRPIELVYVVHFENVYEAISWEKMVKGWNRKKKAALIRGDFEALPPLSKKLFIKKCHAE